MGEIPRFAIYLPGIVNGSPLKALYGRAIYAVPRLPHAGLPAARTNRRLYFSPIDTLIDLKVGCESRRPHLIRLRILHDKSVQALQAPSGKAITRLVESALRQSTLETSIITQTAKKGTERYLLGR